MSKFNIKRMNELIVGMGAHGTGLIEDEIPKNSSEALALYSKEGRDKYIEIFHPGCSNEYCSVKRYLMEIEDGKHRRWLIVKQAWKQGIEAYGGHSHYHDKENVWYVSENATIRFASEVELSALREVIYRIVDSRQTHESEVAVDIILAMIKEHGYDKVTTA